MSSSPATFFNSLSSSITFTARFVQNRDLFHRKIVFDHFLNSGIGIIRIVKHRANKVFTMFVHIHLSLLEVKTLCFCIVLNALLPKCSIDVTYEEDREQYCRLQVTTFLNSLKLGITAIDCGNP